MRLTIISEGEFDVRVRSELASLEARVRRAELDQADLLDRTLPLVHDGEEPSALTTVEAETAGGLASGQARLVRRLFHLAQQEV